MKKLAMRYGMAMAALGGSLAGVAMGQAAPAAPAAPQAPAAPAAGAQGQKEVRPAIKWARYEYACEGGARLSVYLHDPTAKVEYKGHQYLMRRTRSADGNRYSDGKVAWWGKGEGGFLQEDAPDGNGKMIVKDCKLEKEAQAEAKAATVTGTVSYVQRTALPPNTVIQVQLLDVTTGDVPAKVMAETKFTLGDRQVPVAFTLDFDAAKIDAKHKYAMSAKVIVDGEVRFINGQPYPVLTQGHPSHVEMMLKQLAAAGVK